jgi:hypothetical protein
MSLVKVLFEELHQAIDCINELDRQTMKAKLDQHCTLFNYEKKGTNEGYTFDLRNGIAIELCVCVSWSPVKGVQVVKHAIPIANLCPC